MKLRYDIRGALLRHGHLQGELVLCVRGRNVGTVGQEELQDKRGAVSQAGKVQGSVSRRVGVIDSVLRRGEHAQRLEALQGLLDPHAAGDKVVQRGRPVVILGVQVRGAVAQPLQYAVHGGRCADLVQNVRRGQHGRLRRECQQHRRLERVPLQFCRLGAGHVPQVPRAGRLRYAGLAVVRRHVVDPVLRPLAFEVLGVNLREGAEYVQPHLRALPDVHHPHVPIVL
mmetsp:Transcript_33416/g.93780  ORF Transcript_33416/g.93780 Transcript_33416/m.93780 type:complete len:227 (+) Transcript_33416:3121-3801(+)